MSPDDKQVVEEAVEEMLKSTCDAIEQSREKLFSVMLSNSDMDANLEGSKSWLLEFLSLLLSSTKFNADVSLAKAKDICAVSVANGFVFFIV